MHQFGQEVHLSVSVESASLDPVQGGPMRMCLTQGAQDAAWARACLAYGELVERQGRTEMSMAMALAIQKHAYLALGAPEEAALAEQRLEARRRERSDWVSEHHAWVQSLVFSDPKLFSEYLAALRADGELEAQRRMTREIQRRAQIDPAFACSGS